jgi:phenylpropionate dioxygenase-like ring-hydroxylating dioxygenase large terminal subunit
VLTIDEAAPTTTPLPRVLGGLHRGLPDHWYPIIRSVELGQQPVAVRRFGEELAVWRDSKGAPHIFENRCAHRGAPMALGKIQGDELACSYHGWRYDGAGACRMMPLEPEDSRRAARTCLKAYAAEDRCGYIWMFYGDQTNATPLKVPAELEDPTFQSFKSEYLWSTNWLNVLDNVLDPLHALYLHAGSSAQQKRPTIKAFQITADTEDGFRLGKVGYKEDGSIGSVEGEVEFTLPSTVRLDLVNGVPPKSIMRLVIMPTPIDENNTISYFERGRRTAGVERLRWWFAWQFKYRSRIGRVVKQDRTLLTALGPIGETRLHEHLASSDVGVIHVRRRLNRAFSGGGSESPHASSQ